MLFAINSVFPHFTNILFAALRVTVRLFSYSCGDFVRAQKVRPLMGAHQLGSDSHSGQTAVQTDEPKLRAGRVHTPYPKQRVSSTFTQLAHFFILLKLQLSFGYP